MAAARDAAGRGLIITQDLVGGYMYLRSLIGPEALLYAFYDMPEVVHACMRAWFELADAVIARHQAHVTLDEFFLAEDICYKGGPLISPEMMKAFLFPYYQQLVANIKARQLDRSRHLYVQVDTDGFADPVIPLYREAIGLDVMSPFEVAAGCDVVRTARAYPDLAIFGGIDKRVLAQGRDAIDAMLERIIPVMRARGGYIPTCDHGVPAEVPYADYLVLPPARGGAGVRVTGDVAAHFRLNHGLYGLDGFHGWLRHQGLPETFKIGVAIAGIPRDSRRQRAEPTGFG